MKALFFAVTFAASFAFACPGGHLKSLAFKKKKTDIEWAQIDMVSSTIKAGRGTTILSVLWQSKGAEVMESICGNVAHARGCQMDVGLNFRLLDNPEGILLVSIRNGNMTKKFKVSNFRQTRALCGQTVYPEKK